MVAFGDGRLRSSMADARHTSERDGLVAITLGAAFLGLYLLTLCRTVFWYDSAEYVTAAVALGIPHPPGYPLYTIIGHIFTRLPIEPGGGRKRHELDVCGDRGRADLSRVPPAWHRPHPIGGGRRERWAAESCSGRTPWLPRSIVPHWQSLHWSSICCSVLGSKPGSASLCLPPSFAGLGLGIHLSIATLGLGFALLVWSYGTPVERPGRPAGTPVAGAGFRNRGAALSRPPAPMALLGKPHLSLSADSCRTRPAAQLRQPVHLGALQVGRHRRHVQSVGSKTRPRLDGLVPIAIGEAFAMSSCSSSGVALVRSSASSGSGDGARLACVALLCC